MTPAINLHIAKLVLDGFRPADRQRIADGVQRELARLLAERGVPPALLAHGTAAVIDVAALPRGVALGAATGGALGADAIGRHIADAVYRGLATPPSGKVQT